MLFDTLSFAGLGSKNRVVMPAIHNGYSDRGFVNDLTLAFYERRAAGGAGMIFTGGAAILAADSHVGMLSIHDDQHIEGHLQLSSVIKKHGCVAGIQLFHPGRYSFAYHYGHEVVAPSAVASRLTGQTPRALSNGEVYECAENFARCAVRARESGYDIVEVIMSAGYLVSQFLSPLTNRREDEFGGDFTNRMNFPLLVIKRIREMAGPDFPVSVRLGANDFMPGGSTLTEMCLLARKLEESGASLLNVTGGWHEAPVPQLAASVPRGGYAYLASSIKKQVKIPVVASNRINNPATAERILQLGQADLVSVARGFLADPDWANKAQAGQDEQIRECIGCMACMDEIFMHHRLVCAVNPECGREDQKFSPELEVRPADGSRLLIVGAGPAGLEAACRAAEKGYNVTLVERSDVIGGQWRLAAVPPGKAEFSSLLDYYNNELNRQGVNLVLNRNFTVDDLEEFPADRVIIASGARPFRPEIPCESGAEVLDAWEVLAGKIPRGPDVVVIGGGSTGCETAVYLAEIGTMSGDTLRFLMLYEGESFEELKQQLTRGSYRVKIIEQMPRLAPDMGPAGRWPLTTHLKNLNIKVLTGHRLQEIRSNSVVTEDDSSCEHWTKADSVVLALGSRPENRLFRQVQDLHPHCYLLGDAVKPARLKDAIHSAYLLIQDEF